LVKLKLIASLWNSLVDQQFDTTTDDVILFVINIKEDELMQAYCMKCRTKREMKNAKSIKMKNGKPATQGVCPVCGTKMFRIGKA
jgi:Zn finger protein HypA/HybF involved in hydrogenase expression